MAGRKNSLWRRMTETQRSNTIGCGLLVMVLIGIAILLS
jgi:hypothetical protein